MRRSKLPAAGEVFEVRFPFVRATYDEWDGDSEDGEMVTRPTWKPGIEFQGEDDRGEVYDIAHGVGTMRLTVVSTHRPPKFSARIFYTRRWVNPDGQEFGKPNLRIATADKFRRLSSSYAVGYRIEKPEARPEARE